MKDASRWTLVVLYAVAMAWVESAAVYYLRTIIGRTDPYQPNPLPIIGRLGPVELVRELATLIMLLSIGLLAGRAWRTRLGYSAVAFGVWDIFYYIFLKVICDWPHSLLDWDILFLLPLPWWGPVLAPMSIAALMILWGTLATQYEAATFSDRTPWKAWGLNLLGVALALYAFMADALRVAGQGTEALRLLLPSRFPWPMFTGALLLMAAPIVQLLRCGRAAGALVAKALPAEAIDQGNARPFKASAESRDSAAAPASLTITGGDSSREQ